MVEYKSSEMDNIVFDAEKVENKLKEVTEKIGQIQPLLSVVTDLNKKISNLNTQYTINSKFISSIIEENEAIKEKKIAIDTTKLKSLIEESKLNDETKEFLINERNLIDISYSLLKDNGIKAKIIKQYIPAINKLINKYLSAMDFFVQFEIDENFKETIKSRYRDEFTYENFSDGQKKRIDLALLFAFRALAKMRNSASYKYFDL